MEQCFYLWNIINHTIPCDISGPSSCELKVPLLTKPRPILIRLIRSDNNLPIIYHTTYTLQKAVTV